MLNKIKSSLKWQLISMLTVITVAIVAAIGFFSYYETSKTMSRDVAQFSEQVLHQINLHLNRQYLEYEQSFLVLGTSPDFSAWLDVEPEDKFSLIIQFQSLVDNYMRSFFVRHPEILSFSLLSDRGGEFNYSLTPGLSMDYSLKDEPWLSEVDNLQRVFQHVGISTAYIDQDNTSRERLLLTLAGRFGQSDARGYLKMDITLEPAQAILNELNLMNEGEGLIAKPDGTILVHQNEALVGSKLEPDIVEQLHLTRGTYSRKSADQLIVFDTIPYTGWKTVAILSNKEILASIDTVRDVTISIAAVGTVMMILLVSLVATSVTRRLSNLRSYMKQVRHGNFKDRIHIKGTDEVAFLNHSFNRMLEELETSIQQLTETKLMQQRAAFSAMQSQIHSHFLYNTLESINSMAYLNGQTEIERMSISLSRMLRYSSNYKDALVKLEDEMEHVRYYLNIIKFRFGDKVMFSIDLPEDCRNAQCLKVTLQPIAENAIKHGVETTGEPTQLHIQVRRDHENVYVVFEDNGKQYDEERLAEFQARLQQEVPIKEEYAALTNIGLLNVDYRIRTYYQAQGIGVRIEKGSSLGGVKVTLCFPYRLS